MMTNAAIVGFASVAMAAVAPQRRAFPSVAVAFTNTSAIAAPSVSLAPPVYFTDKAATTTVPLTTFTTYCPVVPTTLTYHGTTVTVYEPKVVTITACKGPCEKVPVKTTETEHASTTKPATVITTYCPSPTTITFASTTHVVTEPGTVTLTCKEGCKPSTVPVFVPETETAKTTITKPAEEPSTYLTTVTKSTETPATVITTKTYPVGTPEVHTETVPGVPVVTVSTVTKPGKPATTVTETPSVHVPENPKETVPVYETPKVSVPVYAPSKPANTTTPPAPTSPTVYDGSASAVSAAGLMAAVGAFVALAL